MSSNFYGAPQAPVQGQPVQHVQPTQQPAPHGQGVQGGQGYPNQLSQGFTAPDNNAFASYYGAPVTPQGQPTYNTPFGNVTQGGVQGLVPQGTPAVPSIPEGYAHSGVPTGPRHATNPNYQQGYQGQAALQQPAQQPVQQPIQQPAKPNLYGAAPATVETGANYIETSLNAVSSELGLSQDALIATYEAAVKHRDPSLVNLTGLANLPPEQAQRVHAIATAAAQYQISEIQAAEKRIADVAGGAEQWNAAIHAFNSKAGDDTKTYVNYLATTGEEVKAAQIVVDYVRGLGLVNYTGQPAMQGNTGYAPASGLSKAEYATELAKIERSIGGRSWNDPTIAAQVAELDRKRAIGRQQGI